MNKVDVTITELTPTEQEPSGGVVTQTFPFDSMLDALEYLDQRVMNFTVFIKVEITPADGNSNF